MTTNKFKLSLIMLVSGINVEIDEIDNIVLVPIVRTAFKSLQEDVIIDIAFHHALKALQLLDDSQNESDRGLSEAVFKLVKIYSTAWGG